MKTKKQKNSENRNMTIFACALFLFIFGSISLVKAVTCKGKSLVQFINEQTIMEVGFCRSVGNTTNCENYNVQLNRCYRKIYDILPYEHVICDPGNYDETHVYCYPSESEQDWNAHEEYGTGSCLWENGSCQWVCADYQPQPPVNAVLSDVYFLDHDPFGQPCD